MAVLLGLFSLILAFPCSPCQSIKPPYLTASGLCYVCLYVVGFGLQRPVSFFCVCSGQSLNLLPLRIMASSRAASQRSRAGSAAASDRSTMPPPSKKQKGDDHQKVKQYKRSTRFLTVARFVQFSQKPLPDLMELPGSPLPRLATMMLQQDLCASNVAIFGRTCTA